MPYINKQNRIVYDNSIEELSSLLRTHNQNNDSLCGSLNYIIFKLIKELTNKGNGGEKTYARFNSILGSLECCKQEIYRRMIGPYEDSKIEENGDV